MITLTASKKVRLTIFLYFLNDKHMKGKDIQMQVCLVIKTTQKKSLPKEERKPRCSKILEAMQWNAMMPWGILGTKLGSYTMCHGQLYQQRMKKAFYKKVKPRVFREGDLVLKKILSFKPDSRGNRLLIMKAHMLLREHLQAVLWFLQLWMVKSSLVLWMLMQLRNTRKGSLGKNERLGGLKITTRWVENPKGRLRQKWASQWIENPKGRSRQKLET